MLPRPVGPLVALSLETPAVWGSTCPRAGHGIVQGRRDELFQSQQQEQSGHGTCATRAALRQVEDTGVSQTRTSPSCRLPNTHRDVAGMAAGARDHH